MKPEATRGIERPSHAGEAGCRRAGELLVVLNPTSGSGAGRRLIGTIHRELSRRGVRHRVEETRGPGHATELARAAAAAGLSAVVAAGGDGTIHEVANGILTAQPSDTALGIIPVGRGNDFVKMVAGARTRAEAYQTVADGAVRRVDAGLVEWDGGSEYFVNALGTGIDVEVVRQIESLRNLPAALVYIVGLARALTRYRAVPLRVRVDERHIERRVMIIAVANGRCVGGSFRVCPRAEIDDGLLDVCVVEEVGLLGAVRVAPRILAGRHERDPSVELLTGHRIEIEFPSEAPVFFQIDGELREPATRRLRIRVLPRALPVMTAIESYPARNADAAADRR